MPRQRSKSDGTYPQREQARRPGGAAGHKNLAGHQSQGRQRRSAWKYRRRCSRATTTWSS